MASSVAVPLETQFGQIAGITQMTSMSALGVTQVVDPVRPQPQHRCGRAGRAGRDHGGRQDPAAALTAPPYYKKSNPADSPIMLLSANSDTLPLITVDDYAENFLAAQIAQVTGVSQVLVFGGR